MNESKTRYCTLHTQALDTRTLGRAAKVEVWLSPGARGLHGVVSRGSPHLTLKVHTYIWTCVTSFLAVYLYAVYLESVLLYTVISLFVFTTVYKSSSSSFPPVRL